MIDLLSLEINNSKIIRRSEKRLSFGIENTFYAIYPYMISKDKIITVFSACNLGTRGKLP